MLSRVLATVKAGLPRDVERALQRVVQCPQSDLVAGTDRACGAPDEPPAPPDEDEPEDAGTVAVNKKPKAAAPGATGDTAEAEKPKPKDKNGIYPDVTESSPPLQVSPPSRERE